MARTTNVVMHDDLSGGKAAETVSFALDGNAYEIDLNKRNAAALRKALGLYIDAGRPAAKPARIRRATSAAPAKTSAAPAKTSAAPGKTRAKRAKTTAAPAKTRATRAKKSRAVPVAEASQAEIRAWATEQGMEVSARGRVSNALREQYLTAHAG